MNIANITTAALTGTSAMTLFSYLISEAKNKQFREPEILAILIQRLFPNVPKNIPVVEGWALHYAVGALFCAGYDRVWNQRKPSFLSGLLLGAACGLLGIGVWKGTLKLHPHPPSIDFSKYAPHLLIAHLIFGVFSALGYRIPPVKAKFIHPPEGKSIQ